MGLRQFLNILIYLSQEKTGIPLVFDGAHARLAELQQHRGPSATLEDVGTVRACINGKILESWHLERQGPSVMNSTGDMVRVRHRGHGV